MIMDAQQLICWVNLVERYFCISEALWSWCFQSIMLLLFFFYFGLLKSCINNVE